MGALELGLEGRVVIITGAGRGLGREIALRFARQGCKVVVLARTLSEIEGLAGEIRGLGAEAMPLQADVSDSSQVRRAVTRVAQHFETIDVLVNNAAINIRKPCLEFSDEEWQSILNINLTGYFFFCREAGRVMVAKRSGKIVNVGSELGVVGISNYCAYASSKGGVIQLTRCLAAEWASYRINVNCVAPTMMDTPMVAELMKDREKTEKFIQSIPLGRLPETGEVADIILFMSSRLADPVTGHILLVDGGYTVV